MTRWLGLVVVMTASVAACGGDDGDGIGDPDANVGIDAPACSRQPVTGDGIRYGVVSLPYTAARANANTYRVFQVDAAGAITFTNTTFEMGRSTIGTIAFTPDREIGVVAQEDGSLGLFRIEGGVVTVLHARLQGAFYAEHVWMGDDGATVYVIDPNTRENGGGVYRVDIGCDDSVTERDLWIPARSPGGVIVDPDHTFVVAREAGASSPAGHDVHMFQTPGAARVGGADAFGDDVAIASGLAVSGDGRFALVGDSQQIDSTPNRIAVVEMNGATVTPRQVLTPVEDPLSIVMSPFNDAALVASGFGDALIALDYNPQTATPFAVRGPLTYVGPRPELPGHAVMISTGALRGLVLVAENLGIRRVRFAAGAVVTDLGKTATGASGFENITGAIGIQP